MTEIFEVTVLSGVVFFLMVKAYKDYERSQKFYNLHKMDIKDRLMYLAFTSHKQKKND